MDKKVALSYSYKLGHWLVLFWRVLEINAKYATGSAGKRDRRDPQRAAQGYGACPQNEHVIFP